MKGDPEERAVQIGRYLVQSGATVRAAAQVFGVSKSTVWKDQCRLQHLAPGLWQEVRAVLLYNKAQRHLRGGEATCAAAKPPAANTCTHSTTMRIRGCTTARATV